MTQENHEYEDIRDRNGHGKAVFTGVILGGITGAVTALLLAPHSGRETRAQIQTRVTDVRDRAGQKLDNTVEQVRSRAEDLRTGVGTRARELRQRGEEVLVEQLDRVSAAAEAGKKNIQGSRS